MTELIHRQVLRANAHIHLPPNFSAFDTVHQAVRMAVDEGLSVLGATNYYDFQVYSEFGACAKAAGVLPLFGLEIITLAEELQRAGIKVNDPGNPGKFYICGKGITRFEPMNEVANQLMSVIREADSGRMFRMISRLAEVFSSAGADLDLDEAGVKSGIVRRHQSPLETVYLQERHVAQAFQEAVFERFGVTERTAILARLFSGPSKDANDAVGVQTEIRLHLMKAGKPAYEPETFVGFDHGYRLVLALGGIPCYPAVADGANPICGFETPVESLIAAIKARGMHCAELIPIRNQPDVLTEYVLAIRQAGLFVTAGTEHNTLDLLPLDPTCLAGVPIPDELRPIFWEGACVVAAHQHLVSQGRRVLWMERGD